MRKFIVLALFVVALTVGVAVIASFDANPTLACASGNC
jgi:hypothetical protein